MALAYRTRLGSAYCTEIEAFVESRRFRELVGKVDLILTSPPYPLTKPKAYGNKSGTEYKTWISETMVKLSALLRPRGSLVIEIGNAWDRGQPTMSTLPLETLLSVQQATGLHVCQQFVWHNPNKIPGPAEWVTIKRVRIKDSHTNIWWYSSTPYPKASNRRVLVPYSEGMEKLLERQAYNAGKRPSGHEIGNGFLKRSAGAIPPSVLSVTNSGESAEYRNWCQENGVPQHPARMPLKVAQFFINFLTNKNGLVLDPFAGSNTTGAAAEALGRRWISVERDERYVVGSRGRFRSGRARG